LKNNKRQKSIIASVLVVFWVAYVAITLGQFFHDMKELAQNEINRRKDNVDYVLNSATSLLVSKKTDALTGTLQEAQKLHLVDFYILQENKDVVSFANNTNKVEDLNHDYVNFDMFLADTEMTFKTIKVFNYRLTVGVYTNAEKMVNYHFKSNLGLFLRDLALVTLALWGVIIYTLKDIINLSKLLQRNNKNEIKNLESKTAEGAVLLRATQEYETTSQKLAADKELYGQTLGPAILEELKSGKQAPYSFESLMVRVDLNGYTQMFLDRHDEFMTELLNEYFAKAREVISRYDGLIYQFVGDEIVFHIKENDKKDAAIKACFCVRALFEEATNIELKHAKKDGIVFKLKASWARGKMSFINLDQGHAMSGLPLIESVRLLNQIDNKTHQFLAIHEGEYEKMKQCVFVFSRTDVLLKGFSEAVQVVKVKDFHGPQAFIAQNHYDVLPYFRSDKDVEILLTHVQTWIKENKLLPTQNLLIALSKVKFQNTSEKLRKTVEDFAHFANKKLWDNKTILATVISSIPQWWGAHEPSERLTIEILKYLEHEDHRVRANTLLALGHFNANFEVIEEYIFDNHQRVAADALLALGQSRFSKKVAKRLEEMYFKGSEAQNKSAAFVMRTLLKHYKETDPVFASANNYLTNWEDVFSKEDSQAA
jgi:Adenylate cyclase, family 3 (some proteins contain HAMP domain)